MKNIRELIEWRYGDNVMERQQVYGTLIKNLPIGSSIVNKEGVIVDFNQSAESIAGYLKNAVMGKPRIELQVAGSESFTNVFANNVY